MVQIKKRSDTKQGWRFMFTICFYQDSSHGKYLEWIREKLNIGYISYRKDKISELRINGYGKIKDILKKLRPYIKFKEKQVSHAREILSLVEKKKLYQTTREETERIAKSIIAIRKENDWSHWRKYSESDIKRIIISGSLSP